MGAQYALSGAITTDKDEAAMFANVILLNATEEFVKGEVADIDGRFTLEAVAAGEYLIVISAVGFQEYRRPFTLTGELDMGTITLSEQALALDEVTVSAKKVAYQRKADRTVVNVASLPTAAGGNALELLAKSPSVRLDRVSGNLALLGRDNVVVFINGRRSRLDGNDLMQYLSTIPAANIEMLELINNPPASYDADGTGGVINIITKNYETDGFNGNVSLFGGYGQRGKYGGATTLNLKAGKLSIYADGAISQDYTVQNSDIISAIQFDDGLLQTDQRSRRPALLGNISGKLGFAYTFSEATSLDVFGSYARRRWELEAETTTNYEGDISPIQRDLLMGSETNTTDQYNLSARFHHRFANAHSLTVDLDYLDFNIVNPTSYRLTDFADSGGEVNSTNFTTDKRTPFHFYVGQLDYRGPLSEQISFSLGVKATVSDLTNQTALSDRNGVVDADNLFTDNILLDEEIYAAYLAVEGQVNEDYAFTAGLRYEYSDLGLTARTEGVDRQLSRFFPSVSLSRSFSETSKLTLAYRERISRPGFQNLAPAFFFLNPYTVLTGNIQALPNINRTLEMTLNHGALFVALSYSNENNPIIRYAFPRLNQDDNQLLLLSDNVDDRQQLGLNVGFPLTLSKVWSSRYSLGGYWRRDEISFAGENIVISEPFFSIDAAQNLQLSKGWAVEISAKWNSLLYQGSIYQPGQFFLNAGLQKQWGRGTLGISWSDILNTGSFLGFINELPAQGVVYDWNYDLEGSIIRLSYTHNFGGQKTKKTRTSGATDVLQRVNE